MRIKYAITTLAVAVGGSLGAYSFTSAEPASARPTPLVAPAPEVAQGQPVAPEPRLAARVQGFSSEPTAGGGRPAETAR